MFVNTVCLTIQWNENVNIAGLWIVLIRLREFSARLWTIWKFRKCGEQTASDFDSINSESIRIQIEFFRFNKQVWKSIGKRPELHLFEAAHYWVTNELQTF